MNDCVQSCAEPGRAPDAQTQGIDEPGSRDAFGVNVREAILHRELAHLMREHAALRRSACEARQDLEAARHALSDERGACAAALAQSATEIGRLSDERQSLALALDAVYKSRSWRITRPIRSASTIARRLLGRLPPASGAPLPSAPMDAVAEPAEAAESARQAGSSQGPPHDQRSVLVVADMLPLFDQSSGGLRLKTLVDMMEPLGWRVVFGSMASREESPGTLSTASGLARYEDALRHSGVNRFLYGSAEILRHLESAGRSLDLAFLSFPHIADALMMPVRRHCPAARIVYDMVDFHGLRMAREAALMKDKLLKVRADHQRDIEVACARSADLTLAINEEEKNALLALAPDAVVEVLPNVFSISEHPPLEEVSERRGLLFIGGFWHRPNGDAITWFVERIWPRIREAEPDATLTIAGSNPGSDVLALGSLAGIEVLGYVPDVAPLLGSHRVSIAPLRWGAGAKGKVGEALAHGLPVVATTIGAEGMSLRDGEHLLVADDEKLFAAHVLKLLRDDELWKSLSASGRKHMQAHFSTQVVLQRLKEVLNG